MDKTPLVFRTRVRGDVQHNDGLFADIQTVGIEGIEKDLLLERIQVHQEGSSLSPAQFRAHCP